MLLVRTHTHTHTNTTHNLSPTALLLCNGNIYIPTIFVLYHTHTHIHVPKCTHAAAPMYPTQDSAFSIEVCFCHKCHFVNTWPPWNSSAGCPSNMMSVWRGLQSWSFAICLYEGRNWKNKAEKEKRFILHAPPHLLTFYLRCIWFPLIHCMIHCQLQNKAYENDVPDAHIVPHSGGNPPMDYLLFKVSFSALFHQNQRVIKNIVSTHKCFCNN